MTIEPFAWKNRPSLIESVLPAQKISAEAQKERKAVHGQTLTGLGSYWKGRKPLILVKACVLGTLLPATEDPAADLAVFEKLMAIDDDAFLRREMRTSCLELFRRLHKAGLMSEEEARRLFVIRRRKENTGKTVWINEPFDIVAIDQLGRGLGVYLDWSLEVTSQERHSWELSWVQSFDYLERVSVAKRPEDLEQDSLFEPIWNDVNGYLGTDAHSIPELVEQIGILRFGHRPKIGDTFCGGGSIPFESSRLGCDIYASDLNPIACMLTWGALNIIGGDVATAQDIQESQQEVAMQVEMEITRLGIEHDSQGNRAKVYLYCLETKCPQTGWMVPMAPSWVISEKRRVVAKLHPNHDQKRFDIKVHSGASDSEMEEAEQGTLNDGEMVYKLDGETYRTRIKTIRGDYRLSDGTTGNQLRLWDRDDIKPRPKDVFQERLYAIQWIKKESLQKRQPETFFAEVTQADIEIEKKIEVIVEENLGVWRSSGLLPDMQIETGKETEGPIRTNGWCYWHQMIPPRALLIAAILGEHAPPMYRPFWISKYVDNNSKSCRWNVSQAGGDGGAKSTFDSQALRTIFNWASRSFDCTPWRIGNFSPSILTPSASIVCAPAKELSTTSSIFITDPPYADAVRYEEITEFFIAWLRKNPPIAFREWVWDSRRPLAIKGSGEDFRHEMIAAYSAMAAHMPDHGLQVVMFTHQDPSVWADMASIVWGAGLQVTAAWYIATETTSELKKGGYVQGTVLLVLRKRAGQESVYRDELAAEIRVEVAKQIDTMVGLNQETKGRGRSENLFEDADLQMAGYAAALRVLTGYRRIDGQDMAAEALRPRQKSERDVAKEMIDYAVTVANEHLVPEGLSAGVWERCTGPERFYLKMLDIEAAGIKKLDNYQNFAKAFRVGDYGNLMGSMKANDARLKSATEFKKATFEGEFGTTSLRALLFALFELQREVDSDEVMAHLRELVPGYLNHREDLMDFCQYLASKRGSKLPDEAGAARVLLTRIKNERLGG